MRAQVDVLLATYQGAAYVQEQIESILNQTYSSVHIWIRDDASQDSTPSLLQQFAARYPDRITFIPNQQNLGVRGNFSELMRHSTAPYIMFCDQDDVWLPNKIESSLHLMKKMELNYGANKPLLVHTDLKVVKTNLTEISSSFWNFAQLNPQLTSLNRLLVQNNVTGCTMLMNRELLNQSQPIPLKAIMHDWWIALVASAFGHIEHLPSATLLYRQHASNDVGARKYGIIPYLKDSLYSVRKNNPMRTYTQAQLFLERYGNQLKPYDKEILETYCSLNQFSYMQRKALLIKYRFLKSGFLRNLHHLFIAN